MTPEQLKVSILQYAIQGKLVEQRPEEGKAEELYQLIQDEKQKLVKNGMIKYKPLPEITEEEKSFAIPDNWKWVRLGDCGCFERGSGIKKDEVTTMGKPCIRYGQLYTTYKTRFSQTVSFVSEELFEKCHKVQNGDIVMALTGENEYDIALAVTYEGNEEVAMGGDMTRLFNHKMNPIYLTYVINSPYGILCKSKMASGNIIVHISNDKLATIPIPLPPLAEQHRIVAKIEELLPYVDRYAEAYENLEQFNAKFPENMKKSILQYAIQGKLVEQREEEGTAEELYQQIQDEKQKLIKEGKVKKEKPLAVITEDEIPFDIPESWRWVRLGQCGCFERGSGIKKDETSPDGFPCVRYGQLYTTYKTRFSEAVSHVPQAVFDKCKKAYKNDLLMALTGENEYDIALAVTYEGDEELAIGGDMTRFFSHCMNPLYLTYVINSRYGILCKSKMASGNIIVHISNDKLATIPIPLPPLEEQNRIIAKIEELLPYCEKLKK